jgi:hypothetical protein
MTGSLFTQVTPCHTTCYSLPPLVSVLFLYSSDLYKRTMHRYMKRCPRPYMTIVRANVDGDFEALVRSRPVGQWRETLALLATYTAQVGLKLCS